MCWEELWDETGCWSAEYQFPGLFFSFAWPYFFGHLLLQGICGTFLGILGCLRQAGRIEERKCRAIRTKIPFPAIQMLLQNLPERKKTLTMKHHQHNCTNMTDTTKRPTTFSTMRVWQRYIRHASRRPQKIVFVIWTFGKEIVVKEYLTIRDVQYFPYYVMLWEFWDRLKKVNINLIIILTINQMIDGDWWTRVIPNKFCFLKNISS